MSISLQPRLHLDIDWRDLASVFAPAPPAREALEAAIAARWPAHAFPALSARTAFDAMLTVSRVPPNAAVAMSAVTIQNMADLVAVHGLRPVAVDIDLATLSPRPADLERVLVSSGARFYVHAHLFGVRNDIGDLVARCRAHHALMIEDCAQAFAGAPTEPPASDLALYSFGPIKAHTCLGGAVAVARDAAFARAVRAALAAHAPMPERWLRMRALKYALLKLLAAPALYGAAVAALQLIGADVDAAIGGAARGFHGDLMTALRRGPSRAHVRLLQRRFVRTTDTSWRSRALATLDAAIAARLQRPGAAVRANAAWLYPVLVEDPAAAVRALRQAGFDATRGATSLRCIDPDAAPNACHLLRHVLYLPIAPAMCEAALRRMATTVCENARRPRLPGPKLAA